MKTLFFLLVFVSITFAEDAASPCSTPQAQLSCGQCVKKHSDCAWCMDPHSTIKDRCRLKSDFTNKTCHPSLVFFPLPVTVDITQPVYPVDSMRPDGVVSRLEPQQVSVRLMPGNSASIPFKYLHRGPMKTMEIQTSEFQNATIKLRFFIQCDGVEKETLQCAVKENQIIEFRIEASMEECSSQGDITLSLGVKGQQVISALYVTPVCGCDCEKNTERNSPLCDGHGHLVCGQCICDASRGGDTCECALAQYGASSAAELENRCHKDNSSEVCSSHGTCECGQCRCDAHTVSGKYCDCDNFSCPKGPLGHLCSGNGVCDCGKCKCEAGWERDNCGCSTDNTRCVENGSQMCIQMVCSNNGQCQCNRCVCNEGKAGAYCGFDDPAMNAKTTTTTEKPPKDDSSESDEDELEGNKDKVEKELAEVSSTAGLPGLALTPLLALFFKFH